MAVFIVIALFSLAITKSITNYKLDREYARQGLDSPRYKVRLAKLATAGQPTAAAEVARPGAKGYFRELWNDAWDDATERHHRIRDEKKAGKRPTVHQRVKGLGQWLIRPIGEDKTPATTPAEVDGAEADKSEPEWLKDTDLPTRPAEKCQFCRTGYVLTVMTNDDTLCSHCGWRTKDGKPAQPETPRYTCPECGIEMAKLGGGWFHPVGRDCIEQTPPAAPGAYAKCSRCGVRDRADSMSNLGGNERACQSCAKDFLTILGQEMAKVNNSTSNNNPGTIPANQGEPTMTNATGDVHDVETCKLECENLADDLTRVDTSLDVIDEAIRAARAATEQIEAWLSSKNADSTTVGGMRAVLDALSSDRIKDLIDAVAHAKAGVQATIDGLAPLEEASQLVGQADGSIINGR